MYEDPGPSSHSNGSIVIHVEPLQSAFFAGETFSARITFTNTAVPGPAANSIYRHGSDPLPERPATTTGATFPIKQHKRAAQSITYGSAPLMNPPTSPGTPQYSSQFSMSTPSLSGNLTPKPGARSDKAPPRKGLIGVRGASKAATNGSRLSSVDDDGDTITGMYGKRPLSKRSLSVDVTSRGPLVSASTSSPPKDELLPSFQCQ